MSKLNIDAIRAIEMKVWAQEFAKTIDETDRFLCSLRKKDPRVIDVEFRVVPDVKGELTNEST